jgi:hypothetical protein
VTTPNIAAAISPMFENHSFSRTPVAHKAAGGTPKYQHKWAIVLNTIDHPM